MNTLLSNLSQIPAYILSSLMYQVLGIKASLTTLFITSMLGAFLYMLSATDSVVIFALLILMTKFGVTGTFNVAYFGTAHLFPAAFTSSAFGICNLVARLATIFAPLVAEMMPPIPMLLFSTLCAIGTICSYFILEEQYENNKIADDCDDKFKKV